MNIIEKIRKSRQSVVEVDGHKYTIQRPTELEASVWLTEVKGETKTQRGFRLTTHSVKNFVCDWDLTELDLYPGGAPIKAEFSPDILFEYLSDHADTMTELNTKIYESWVNYITAQGESEKKPGVGSTEETPAN
jgi:hypothetical protein